MPVRFALSSLLALGGACAVGSTPAAAQTTTLPSGNGDAFRKQMTGWSAPAPPPALVAPQDDLLPATLPRLSSGFGYRADPLHGAPRMHYGLDIPGPLGTPVLASGGGFVVFSGNAGSYGQMVEIDHGNGLRTRYAHLSRLLVRAGDMVDQRQSIALMGSTGRSTGSHLHFEVRVNGQAADPAPLMTRAAATFPVRPILVDSAPHVSDFARRRAAASAKILKGAP